MKKINFKKINTLLFSLIVIFSFSFNIVTVEAQCAPGYVLDPQINECVLDLGGNGNSYLGGAVLNDNKTYEEENYIPLANLPGYPEEGFSFEDDCPLGKFLNIFINIFIGIVAAIAMVMIVMGGISYVTSDLVTSKEEARSSIKNAIFGLIIALTCYLILNTINPSLLNLCLNNIPKVTQKIQEQQIQGRLGNGKCEEAQSGPCAKSNLSAFSNPSQASAICNGESGNGKYLASELDKGSDGNPFSFGLFQINIIAHGDKIGNGQICKNIFKVDPNPPGKVGNSINDSTLGGCLERKNGICLKYAATVIDSSRYNACKNFISQTNENIKYASQLQKKSGWGQWGFNKSCGY